MKKALLLALFFLLNGCSYESLLALGEVDKVEVVKKNASVSHYRAYFTRTQLKPIKNRQKYLYFFNKQEKDLAILLHRYDDYYLYSIYHPKQQTVLINSSKKTSFNKIKRILHKKGYTPIIPTHIAATTKVALRRYKGIKTLLVEVHDYSRLQAKYKNAIQNYDANKIKNLKTKLPHRLISSYYNIYLQKTKQTDKLAQLQIIAKKLRLHDVQKAHTNALNEEKKVQDALAQEIPEILKVKAPSFNYYANESSFDELHAYLNDTKSKDALSFNQYTQLKQRHNRLNEAKILKEGSLEELISIYKTNKNPKYKQRILLLMKEAQE